MLEINESSLKLNLSHGEQSSSDSSSEFHYVWLRDNCDCAQCKHPDTDERIMVTALIADDIAPTKAEIQGNDLLIEWNQYAHQSLLRKANCIFGAMSFKTQFRIINTAIYTITMSSC